MNLNASSVVGRNNDLTTTFNGNEESGQNFYYNDGSVIEINGADGVIDSVTDATPSTPTAITVASGSTTDTTWDVTVTGNTTVARVVRLYYGTSNGSTSNNVNFNASSQGSSVSTTTSALDVSALSGNDVFFSARFENEAENGSQFSFNNGFPLATTSVSTSESAYDETAVDGQVKTSASKTFSIALASGNTTITFAKVSGTTQFNVKFAAVTSGTPSSFVNSGNTITLSASSSVIVRTQFEGRGAFVGTDGDYRITVTNNSQSATLDVNMVTILD